MPPDAALSRRDAYERDGYLSPVDIVPADEAARHRAVLENAEAQVGPLHYLTKIHTILRSPFELATSTAALDVVESLIGPDILLYNVSYIIKEPRTTSHVSWHQDLTYWGLSHDDQVSMWLALSPATPESGCMRMVPGSHRLGCMDQDVTDDPDNILFHGQTVKGVDTTTSVPCALAPGQASFHHGWTVHASMPNTSTDRRIGVNVQYVAPHNRQTKIDGYTALLVRGDDRFGHYVPDMPAEADLNPAAMKRREHLEQVHRQTAGTI